MPFPTLASLPDRIKKLSAIKQRKWRAVWNSVFSQTDSEGRAFAAANSAIQEAVDMKKNRFRSINYIQDLSEAMPFASISSDKSVIENVVLLTGEKVSRNKTFYTKKALAEAVKRYEGAKMYIDHPGPNDGPNRSIRDFGGTYKNLRIEEGKFLKADLHLLPRQDIRDVVIPIAEAKPMGVGLSIRDHGKGREEDGVFLVEGFAPGRGFSIDLVTEASVNENLFESETGGNKDMKIEEVKLSDLEEGNPSLLEKIRGEAKTLVMKELEEKLKKGEDANKMLIQGRKLLALAEADLPAEVREKLKVMVEPDSISLEMAESFIKAQKEIVEAISKTKPGEPKVKGHGGTPAGKTGDETELPSDEALVEAFNG